MIDTDAPKGYDCQCCKKNHKYPAYVFAHWDVTLTHKCDECGATHDILRGVAGMKSLPQELPDNADPKESIGPNAKPLYLSPGAQSQDARDAARWSAHVQHEAQLRLRRFGGDIERHKLEVVAEAVLKKARGE